MRCPRRDLAGRRPAVAFLASDAARWVTAQNIRVNGGTA
jgi:NAD(P)-dependent dehydrogenase (short-subunit alcohol dehydrogenase family)